MYRVAAKHVFLLWILTMAIIACGRIGVPAGQEEAQGRTIPESSLDIEGKPLPAGEYVSDEFRPATSFRLAKGWRNGIEHYDTTGHSHRRLAANGESVEMRHTLTLFYAPDDKLVGTLNFFVDPEVYRVVNSYEAKKEPTPRDMAAWLQQNPYLDSDKPRPVTVGGEKGVRFDTVPSRVPEEYISCGKPCLPLFQTADPNLFYALVRSEEVRFLVLDNVKGETVTIAIKAEADEFDRFASKAQQVLNTVKWTTGK